MRGWGGSCAFVTMGEDETHVMNPLFVLHGLSQQQWVWWVVGGLWASVLVGILYCGLKPEAESAAVAGGAGGAGGSSPKKRR
jgi:hypothetical protein